MIQDRNQLYSDIARELKSSYDQIRSSFLDTELTGSAGEDVLKSWVQKWIPKRVALKSATVISQKSGPTDQLDCLLFDHVDSPVFHRITSVDILPIEGVFGAIEINTGEKSSYSKIIKDAEKLSNLAKLADERLPRFSKAYSHLPVDFDRTTLTQKMLIDSLVIHKDYDQKQVYIIFTEDINGSLEEVSKRLMQHNKSGGIKNSIDGLFVLDQGYALHLDPNQNGWITSRQPNSGFGFLKATQGQVLLKMQSIILVVVQFQIPQPIPLY